MHLIFILARHRRRFLLVLFVSINGPHILVMMEHLAMQQEGGVVVLIADIYESLWLHAHVRVQIFIVLFEYNEI